MKFLKVGLHLLIAFCGVGAIIIGSQTYGIVTNPIPNLNKLVEREVPAPHGDNLVAAGAFLVLAGSLLTALELVPEDGLEFSEPKVPVLAFRYQATNPVPASAPVDSPEGIEEEEEEGTDVWGGYDAEELAEALDSIEASYNNTKQTA